MNKKQSKIHELILNGGCKSKLLLAFKTTSNLDEAKEEEKIAEKVHVCHCKLDKNGWFERD